MLNRVQFIGNLTRDTELSEKEGSKARAVLFLAVNERFRAKDGWQSRADFPIIVAFGARAEYAGTLTKGEPVFVEASYRTDRYEKDGETRFSHQLVATTIRRLRSTSDGESS